MSLRQIKRIFTGSFEVEKGSQNWFCLHCDFDNEKLKAVHWKCNALASLYIFKLFYEFLLELLASFDGIFTSFMLLSQQNFYFKIVAFEHVMSNLIKCEPSMIRNSNIECLFLEKNWNSASLKTLLPTEKFFSHCSRKEVI